MIIRIFMYLFSLGFLLPGMAWAGPAFPSLMSGDPIGLALIAAGMLLVIAEALIISHGLLALIGALFFILGSTFVIQTANPAMKLLWLNFLSSGLFIIAGFTALMLYAIHLYRKSTSYKFALTGQKALVIDWNDTTRRVEIDGAFWNASSFSGKEYQHGDWVTILTQDNLTLFIE